MQKHTHTHTNSLPLPDLPRHRRRRAVNPFFVLVDFLVHPNLSLKAIAFDCTRSLASALGLRRPRQLVEHHRRRLFPMLLKSMCETPALLLELCEEAFLHVHSLPRIYPHRPSSSWPRSLSLSLSLSLSHSHSLSHGYSYSHSRRQVVWVVVVELVGVELVPAAAAAAAVWPLSPPCTEAEAEAEGEGAWW